ncbi:MAG: hypothetical protein ACKOE8_04105 [Opitutaceae bacterium]
MTANRKSRGPFRKLRATTPSRRSGIRHATHPATTGLAQRTIG